MFKGISNATRMWYYSAVVFTINKYLPWITCQLNWLRISSSQTVLMNVCQNKPDPAVWTLLTGDAAAGFRISWCHLVTVSVLADGMVTSCYEQTLDATWNKGQLLVSPPQENWVSAIKTQAPSWTATRSSKTCQAVRTSRWETLGLLLGIVTIKVVKQYHLDQRITAWDFHVWNQKVCNHFGLGEDDMDVSRYCVIYKRLSGRHHHNSVIN